MAVFNVIITPGKVFTQTELVTPSKLNQLGTPTATIENMSETSGSVTGQALVYNAATGVWEPGTVGAAYLTPAVGASATAAGVQGAVPAPAAGQQAKFLRADMTYVDPPSPDPINPIYPYLLFR